MLVSYRQILFSFALAGVAALTGCSGSAPPSADPGLKRSKAQQRLFLFCAVSSGSQK
jgi:hypothetical protein